MVDKKASAVRTPYPVRHVSPDLRSRRGRGHQEGEDSQAQSIKPPRADHGCLAGQMEDRMELGRDTVQNVLVLTGAISMAGALFAMVVLRE